MTRKSEINRSVAARALAKASVASRMQNLSPEQRSAQARKAVLSRNDRKKPGPWFAVVLYPKGYTWKGAKDAARVLDEMANTPPVFWSQDRAEARAKAREYNNQGRMAEIIEQEWSPRGKFVPVWESRPDPKRAVRGLREVLP
jgi:hypothetical protein